MLVGFMRSQGGGWTRARAVKVVKCQIRSESFTWTRVRSSRQCRDGAGGGCTSGCRPRRRSPTHHATPLKPQMTPLNPKRLSSQEPDASFLARGAASTARALGLRLLQWAGKPQGRNRHLSKRFTLSGHSRNVVWVDVSPDGKRVVSVAAEWSECHRRCIGEVTLWDAETGDEVSVHTCHLPSSQAPSQETPARNSDSSPVFL